MKHFFTFLGIAGILVVALTATNVAAQSPQPTPTATPPIATIVPMPQGQYPQAAQAPAQQNWGMGMRGGGMMGAGKMGGRMGGGRIGWSSTPMSIGAGMMLGQMSGTTGGYGMFYGSMMYGVTPMHDDVAYYLGMTTQDLYNQMAVGNSMVQISAQRGVPEQQLMDAIMAGRHAAYNQAVRGGYMTQAQADALLQNMNYHLRNMVNGQGYGSSGWSMMWDTQPAPQTAP